MSDPFQSFTPLPAPYNIAVDFISAAMLNRIFSILSAQWLIHQDTAISYLPVLIAFVRGQDFSVETKDNPIRIVTYMDPMQPVSTVGRWNLDNPDIPENSVAVLMIDGPITSWNSMDLMARLKMAEANPRINSVILQVNSPGGMVSQLDLLVGTIKNLQKPVVSVITGMAASAAMWLISATSYRIATSKIDMIGSIGAKVSLQDFSGLLAKIGIKIEDFYASKSTRKEEEYRAWKESGDTEKITGMVDFINEAFHAAIRENLGIKADSEVFTGAVYFAEQAKSLGLINEINSPDYALAYAYKVGLINKINTQSKSLNLSNK